MHSFIISRCLCTMQPQTLSAPPHYLQDTRFILILAISLKHELVMTTKELPRRNIAIWHNCWFAQNRTPCRCWLSGSCQQSLLLSWRLRLWYGTFTSLYVVELKISLVSLKIEWYSFNTEIDIRKEIVHYNSLDMQKW